MQVTAIVINHRALRHNLQHLRELAPASRMVAVMKANAYGHGLLKATQTLPDVDAFDAIRFEEAPRLRAGGITKPAPPLEGFFDARDLPTTSAQHFHTTVHDEEQLAALEEVNLDEPVTVQMKLDISIHRLGVESEQAEALCHRPTQCKSIRQPVNIVSHFARADEPKYGAVEKQLTILNTFCENRPGQRSIATSSGILLWPQSHFNWMRPNIILYGVSLLENHSTGADFDCQPVMSLTSSLIAVHEHKAGGPVGYGRTRASKRDTRLGVVAMGYDDGYPRVTPSDTLMLVNGREVPIIERMVIDTIYVNLSPQVQDRAGGPVILWGEGLPAERIAEIAKVSAYKLIMCLTSRVAMKYVD